MRLALQHIDMRGGYLEAVAWETEIIDQDTGKKVGTIYHETKPAKRHISLFGGTYKGDFISANECTAFAKGVEAVLNHMVAAEEEQLTSEEAA